MLQKKSDFLEGKIIQELKTAKNAGLKNKRVALNALKRKRRYGVLHCFLSFFWILFNISPQPLKENPTKNSRITHQWFVPRAILS